MLDRAQLLQEVARFSDQLFCDNSQEFFLAREAWERLCGDPSLIRCCALLPHFFELPSFDEIPNNAIDIAVSHEPYTLLSVDGSQIYPDRHSGIACYLINIGMVSISYNMYHRPLFKNIPLIFSNYEQYQQGIEATPEMVNGQRQELELSYGLALSRSTLLDKKLLLFDGSLIFWHLERKDGALKDIFLQRYLDLYKQLSSQQMPYASYISLPRSRELINIIRFVLADCNPNNLDKVDKLSRLTDMAIAQLFLKPGQRSILFKNNSAINTQYDPHITTYFFYLNVQYEIARVEIPQWIAQDESLVHFIASCVLDQCQKGRGYPVALAEAHEQAVVKGPDRDFFYHAMRKLGIEQQQRVVPSQKSIKKRGMVV